MPDDKKPLFSRRISNPIGKCTERMDVWLPEEAVDMLAYLALSSGTNKGEYVRDIILEKLFGAGVIAQLKQEQRNG